MVNGRKPGRSGGGAVGEHEAIVAPRLACDPVRPQVHRAASVVAVRAGRVPHGEPSAFHTAREKRKRCLLLLPAVIT